MKRFYIIANTMKEKALAAQERLLSYLEDKGAVCYISADMSASQAETSVSHIGAPDPARRSVSRSREQGYRYTDASRIPADTECVLVLGGDGTLLQASRDLIDLGLPLLGINLGTLGYLAEIEMSGARSAMDALLEDQFTIENRMMLRGEVRRGGQTLLQDIALNDIVISRRGPLKVIEFTIYVNETLLCSYRADGIIAATATGSTGYSLSVGGPIVAPNASLILLSAIAPHTLNSRPIVLPDDVSITVEVGGQAAEVSFDGDINLKLRSGDRIVIQRAQQSTKLLKIHNTSFVENLRMKMN